MKTSEFQIEFTYEEISYVGLVQPIVRDDDISYRVSLESDNQETYLDLILTPSDSDLEDWNYTCDDGDDATRHYDKALLDEVGERIEAYLTKSPTH
jgi:hypothetical protein